jgi:hypothetical protein
MFRSKAFYVAASPILLLMLIIGGARVLPMVLTDHDAADNVPIHIRRGPPPKPPVPADPATQKQVETTVSAQIALLRKAQYAEALRYASGGMQKSVEVDRFRSMIESRYSPMQRSVKHTFEKALTNGMIVILPTVCIAPNGEKTSYVYSLQKESGGWRIWSCSPLYSAQHAPAGLGRRPIDAREI